MSRRPYPASKGRARSVLRGFTVRGAASGSIPAHANGADS